MTAGFSTVLLDALAGGLTVRFRAQGGSMYPTIRDGEVITVAPVPTATFNGGDVLLCRCGSRVLAHRVIARLRRAARAMASRVNAIMRRQRYRLRDALCYPSPPFWA